MSRGRKPALYKVLDSWEDLFWNSLSTYIRILDSYFRDNHFASEEIGNCLDKLSFTIPKGLNSKEINVSGIYPVISQSKEYIIGFSDREDLVVKDDLPLVIFGDHSKTLKYANEPFIIGADGVKLIKPKKLFYEKFFYYFLHGVITYTKDYGRHFGLLRKGHIPLITSIELQKGVVDFLEDLKVNIYSSKKIYFNKEIEEKIFALQNNQIVGLQISTELTHQLDTVKKLRQAFLREAMQGKLIEQNPNDEPASELLKKIKAEKEKLPNKRTKEKPLAPIKPEEIPFEIPENWVWCRLGEICEINPRNKVDDDLDVAFSPMPLIHASYKKNAEFEVRKWKQIKSGFTHFADNDVVVAKITPCFQNSKAAVMKGLPNGVGAGTTELYVLRSYHYVLPDYIYLLIKNPSFLNEGERIMRGVAGQQRVPREFIENRIIPLPPLAEQERIVNKLEKLMSFCDELEKSIKQSKEQNEKLLQQVLREALSPN